MVRTTAALLTNFQPIARVATHALLGLWCRHRPDQVLHPAPELQRGNDDLQNRLAAVFRRYDVCRKCVAHCCHSRVNRLDYIDCYLLERPLGDGRSPWHQPGHLFEAIAEILGRLLISEEAAAPEAVCCDFDVDGGCTLPPGRRPSMCITGGCGSLLTSFTDEDCATFVALLHQHARLRRRCVVSMIKAFLASGGAESTADNGWLDRKN